MSLECEIAEKVVAKKRKQAEIDTLNNEIKDLVKDVEKAFAVEYDGYAVTVKPQKAYQWAPPRPSREKPPMPITSVVPLIERCGA